MTTKTESNALRFLLFFVFRLLNVLQELFLRIIEQQALIVCEIRLAPEILDEPRGKPVRGQLGREATITRQMPYPLEQVQTGDTVIVEIVERNLPNILKYPPELGNK